MDAIPVLIAESNYHQLLNQCELLEIEVCCQYLKGLVEHLITN